MPPLRQDLSPLQQILYKLHQVAELDDLSAAFIVEDKDLIPGLSRAVGQLLNMVISPSQEEADSAYRLVSQSRVESCLLDAANIELGKAENAERFLRELKAVLIGEQIVLAANRNATDDLRVLIPQMVGVLQGSGDVSPLPEAEPARRRGNIGTPWEIAAPYFAAMANRMGTSKPPVALRQASGWVRRRWEALDPPESSAQESADTVQAPIVRAHHQHGELGWLYVVSAQQGWNGCYPQAEMLCYLRDQTFEDAVETAWLAARAFVQNPNSRRQFVKSPSAEQIQERLEKMELSWRVEIGRQREKLEGDSIGAALAVAFVSALTGLPYDSTVLLSATTDENGYFGHVGFTGSKIKIAFERDFRVLVSKQQRDVGISDQLQAVENIGEALQVLHARTKVRGKFQGAGREQHYEQAYRREVLKRVRFVFEQLDPHTALWNAMHLRPTLKGRPDAVVRPCHQLVGRVGVPELAIAEGTPIDEVYEKAQGDLLILGDKGAGKSTLLLELAERLLREAEDDPSQPIPVILDLSLWSGEHSRLEKWLLQHLTQAQGYRIPYQAARNLLENRQLLLLLDGLDEVIENRRADCIEAINNYRNPPPPSRFPTFSVGGIMARDGKNGSRQETALSRPIVVCCRTTEYEAIQNLQLLHLNHAVMIQPLTRQQVDDYLNAGGEEFRGLRQVLEEKPALYDKFFTTPLRLSVAVITYAGQSASELLRNVPEEALDQILWDAYIERMFVHKHEDKPRYEKQKALSWLAWMGHYLNRKSGTYLIEEMQPADLPAAYHRFLVRWSFALLTSIYAFCLLYVIVFGRVSLALLLALPWLYVGYSRNIMMDYIWQRSSRSLFRKGKFLFFGILIGAAGGAAVGAVAGAFMQVIKGALFGSEAGAAIGGAMGAAMGYAGAVSDKVTFEHKFLNSKLRDRPNVGIWNSLLALTTGSSNLSGREKMLRFVLLPFYLVLIGFPLVLLLGAILRTAGPKGENAVGAGVIAAILAGYIIGSGIQQGVRMAIAFLLSWGSIGLAIYLLKTSPPAHSTQSQTFAWLIGMFVLLFSSFILGMHGGLRTVFQHYLLRYLLWSSGHFPYKIEPFLNWSTDRILVERERGGWRFIHKTLEQRFAERYQEALTAKSVEVTED